MQNSPQATEGSVLTFRWVSLFQSLSWLSREKNEGVRILFLRERSAFPRTKEAMFFLLCQIRLTNITSAEDCMNELKQREEGKHLHWGLKLKPAHGSKATC